MLIFKSFKIGKKIFSQMTAVIALSAQCLLFCEEAYCIVQHSVYKTILNRNDMTLSY